MREEVERLRSENEALKLELGTASLELPDMDAIASRTLKNLKLGSQSPGHKAARKALTEFIKQINDNTKRRP